MVKKDTTSYDGGCVVLPRQVREKMGLSDGDILDLSYNEYTLTVTARKHKKTFEECVLNWYKANEVFLNSKYVRFYTEGDYTFCTVKFQACPSYSRAGFAKRYKDDLWCITTGRVAAYAKAMGHDLNKMIGYKED